VNRRIRHTLLFLATLWALSLTAGCAHQRGGTLTVLHTNDMHSQYLPVAATWIQKEPKPLIGGIVALDDHIRQARAKYNATLLLDAGDIMTGTPLAQIELENTLGGAFVDMLNTIGYQASTIGNHEFDEGQENLHRILSLARHDVLSANLYKNDKLVAPKPYAIYKVEDLRIGVIGLTLTALDEMTAKKNLDGIRVLDPVATAQKYIDEIDAQTDLIILLTHQGVDEDRKLAQGTRGADVIVGGHSHTRLNKAIIDNKVIIVQADSKTRYLGRLSLKVAADTVSHFDYNLIPVWVDSVKNPNPALAERVTFYQQQIDAEYGKVIGHLVRDWIRDSQSESNIGNFMADVVREQTGTDFAVLNSGGIRKDMVAGPLKKLDIVEILPFTNYVVTFTCSGAELLTMLKTNAKAAAREEPGILQVSGLRYAFKVLPWGDIELSDVMIAGKPVEAEKIYSGATVDYVLFGQTDRYFGFTPSGKAENTNILVNDIVMDYIVKHPQIDAKIEGRIVRLP